MHAIDRRIGLLFGGFVLLLAIAGLRAVDLGVFRSGSLSHWANSQEVSNQVIQPVRGVVTDRDGQVLALSESSDTVDADPAELASTHEDPSQVARLLAPLLGMREAALAAELGASSKHYVKLAVNVPSANWSKIKALTLHGQPISGLWNEPSEHRVYPLKSTAAQVLGWVGGGGDGQSGIEYVFNRYLSGRPGLTRVVNDGNQQAISVQQAKPMVPGAKISLTISSPLQQEVEQVLAKTVATYGGTAATAIVTDPQNGQILADANWPTLDANHIGATPFANTEDQSVGLSYEPGSTFKAITVAAGLMDHTITPDTVINEPPSLSAGGGYTISDAEPHGYASYTVSKILQVSSNIGADMIAQRDGPEHGAERFNYWMHKFGFGRPTGVALNGESPGVIPSLSAYSGDTMYNLPFGQGEEVTPMQMVQFYDAIANGGILRRPQLIQSIANRALPTPSGKRILTPRVADEMRQMMRGVLADGGTASGAQIPGYDLAGKTGTAQVVLNGKYSDSLFNASFIGMVPASHPKLLVAVVDMNVNNGYGGTVAGQAFQKIVGWAVPHFGINPCPSPCPATAYQTPTPSTP